MRLDAAGDATLINSYHRRYFATPNGKLRLTVDQGIQSFNQLRSARPNLRAPEAFPDVVVLELKTDVGNSDLLRRAIQDIPLRVSRFSKYCVALQNFIGSGGGRIGFDH